jgi:iron complex outermembrane receptor protein
MNTPVMRIAPILLIIFLSVNTIFAQDATIKGVVKDQKSGEVLESVSVVQPPANGTSTNEKGEYSLTVKEGNITLIFSYIGTNPDTQYFKIKAGETKTLNISLTSGMMELQQVVIGESKIGIKLQKVTQSVDVMKPRLLEANNITNLQGAVTKVPGVTVLDGQMSIRGGSGYAYGSGSRVILVVDEMPLMSADRGEIKWAFIPVENVAQMEISKGASAMQYGSSALNGVLNVTTNYAQDTPSTKFTFFYEGIGKPPVDSFKWWKRDGNFFNNPNTAGMSFLHKQKFGDIDLVVSGMLQGQQSYFRSEYDYFTRFNTKLRYQPSKLKRLTVELSTNLMYRRNGSMFFWQDAGHPYISAPGVDLNERFFTAFIDPKFKFVDKKNNQHKLYTRVFRQKSMESKDGPNFWIFRAEYQFRKDFGKIFRLLLGVNNEHWIVQDGTLGNHVADFGGGFVQGEVNYKFFSFNAGARMEFVRLDSIITPAKPVFRAGMNFEIKKYNYLRASFGQAYRIPTIAERYVTYELSGIQILPNPDVRPESGFTAELGYKRSLKIGNWLGYFDAALFWTEFKDMIEFNFDIKIDNTKSPPAIVPYFQSQNVTRARIFGWEVSAFGEGKMGPVDFTTMLGYTYFYGVDLNDTSATRNVGDFICDAFRKFYIPTAQDDYTWDSLTAGMLKYRNRHQFKADFDFILYDRVRLGTSLQFYGYMTKVDRVFEVFIRDVQQLRRDRRNQGDFVWDLRAGYVFNPNIQLNFLVKNVLNNNYAIRVAKPNPPRSFTVQMVVNFGGMNKNLSATQQNRLSGM